MRDQLGLQSPRATLSPRTPSGLHPDPACRRETHGSRPETSFAANAAPKTLRASDFLSPGSRPPPIVDSSWNSVYSFGNPGGLIDVASSCSHRDCCVVCAALRGGGRSNRSEVSRGLA